jgi:hypothetical protein
VVNVLETRDDGGSKFIVPMGTDGAEPQKRDIGVGMGISLMASLDGDGCICNIGLNRSRLDGFAQQSAPFPGRRRT